MINCWAACYVLLSSLLPPETKLGQGNIFSSMCQEFCPQGGGGSTWAGTPPLGRYPLQVGTPPGRYTLLGRYTPRTGTLFPCAGTPPGSMSRRYAFYWNAFLLFWRQAPNEVWGAAIIKGKTLTFCSLHRMTTVVLKWRQFREYRYFSQFLAFIKCGLIDRKHNRKRTKFQWSLRTRKTIIYASLHVKFTSGTKHLSREVLFVQPKDFPIKQSCRQSLQVTF